MTTKNKESIKNKLGIFQKVSGEFHEIHFPARVKVEEETLAIIVASVAVSAMLFAIDTVTWQIVHIFL